MVFSTDFSETVHIIRRAERDIFINVNGSSCKVALSVSGFNKTLIFSTYVRKIIKYKFS